MVSRLARLKSRTKCSSQRLDSSICNVKQILKDLDFWVNDYSNSFTQQT